MLKRKGTLKKMECFQGPSQQGNRPGTLTRSGTHSQPRSVGWSASMSPSPPLPTMGGCPHSYGKESQRGKATQTHSIRSSHPRASTQAHRGALIQKKKKKKKCGTGCLSRDSANCGRAQRAPRGQGGLLSQQLGHRWKPCHDHTQCRPSTLWENSRVVPTPDMTWPGILKLTAGEGPTQYQLSFEGMGGVVTGKAGDPREGTPGLRGWRVPERAGEQEQQCPGSLRDSEAPKMAAIPLLACTSRGTGEKARVTHTAPPPRAPPSTGLKPQR